MLLPIIIAINAFMEDAIESLWIACKISADSVESVMANAVLSCQFAQIN